MSNLQNQLRCRRRGCSYATNRPFNLERHERNHEKGKVPVSLCQPCPHCSFAAGTVHNLMRHIGKKHVGLVIDKKPQKQQSSIVRQPEQRHRSKKEEKRPPHLQQQQSLPIGHKETPDASFWHWSTPQQQEKNFLRRSGLAAELKILERTVKMFKLYALVKARGGAANVDEWNDVAAAAGLPQGSGSDVRTCYIDVLYEFEQNEQKRLDECCRLRVPPWWDDGDYITDNINCMADDVQFDLKRPSVTIRNNIVKMIFDKYYMKHLKNAGPFERFEVKDSWLRATMLNYQALKYQMHLRHPVP